MINHRFVETNGIKMHVAEQGEGPLVVLCHGFPELWYSWRHQLPALAGAGYHVVAPDQRGYGQTGGPEAIEAYGILQLTADIVGLVQALGEEQAVIVGHDWGAPVAWHCALLRPDVFRGVALLSVPYRQPSWSDTRPTDAMKRMPDEGEFYQLYFQEPGRAEAELEADVRRAMGLFLYGGSGDVPPEGRGRVPFTRNGLLFANRALPETLPPWLAVEDLDFFTREFERTGFRGGLNWYRNIDRMWEQTRFLTGAKVRQPALFAAGEFDAVITMYRKAYDVLEETMPNLKVKTLLPGAGHWIQQERPDEINRLLVEFLNSSMQDDEAPQRGNGIE